MQSALERRQELLAVMNVRRHDTVENLAFEFGVSARTIRRDIEILSMDNPIYTVQGNSGGIQMMEGRLSGRKYLSDKQEDILKKLLLTVDCTDAETLREILKAFAVPQKGERRSQN